MQPFDVKKVYAAGTAYTLTNTAAALDFGTTDPSVTINSPGTWLILARAVLEYTGATFAANRTATIKLSRTNNTAADVTNATTAHITNIVTTETYTEQVQIPPVIYTTENNNDVIVIKGSINTVPSAGTIDAVESEIIAIKLY